MPFIVFEGPDGGGKSRQLALAADKIEAHPKGRRVVRVREPGGTPSVERVLEILLATESGALSTATEVFLFMAARAELTAQVIRPALKAGSVVLSDRYLLSSVVYQGVAGGLGAEAVATMGELATGGLTPDLTIVLDVPPDVGLQRRAAERSHDRMEQKGAEYHSRVREWFLSLARRDPERVIVVDGTRPLDDVAVAVWEHVTRVLAHLLD